MAPPSCSLSPYPDSPCVTTPPIHSESPPRSDSACPCSANLTHWQRYGPTYLLAIATPLVLADQVRHVLQGKALGDKGGGRHGEGDMEGFWKARIIR